MKIEYKLNWVRRGRTEQIWTFYRRTITRALTKTQAAHVDEVFAIVFSWNRWKIVHSQRKVVVSASVAVVWPNHPHPLCGGHQSCKGKSYKNMGHIDESSVYLPVPTTHCHWKNTETELNWKYGMTTRCHRHTFSWQWISVYGVSDICCSPFQLTWQIICKQALHIYSSS